MNHDLALLFIKDDKGFATTFKITSEICHSKEKSERSFVSRSASLRRHTPRGPRGGGGDAPVPDPFPDKLGPSGAQHPDSAGALSLGTPPWCPLSSAGSVKMSAFGAYHLCTDNTLDISVVWRPCPP